MLFQTLPFHTVHSYVTSAADTPVQL